MNTSIINEKTEEQKKQARKAFKNKIIDFLARQYYENRLVYFKENEKEIIDKIHEETSKKIKQLKEESKDRAFEIVRSLKTTEDWNKVISEYKEWKEEFEDDAKHGLNGLKKRIVTKIDINQFDEE